MTGKKLLKESDVPADVVPTSIDYEVGRMASRETTAFASSGRTVTVVPFTLSTEWRSCLRSSSNSFLCLFGTRSHHPEADVPPRCTDERKMVGPEHGLVCHAQMGRKSVLSSAHRCSHPFLKAVSVAVAAL